MKKLLLSLVFGLLLGGWSSAQAGVLTLQRDFLLPVADSRVTTSEILVVESATGTGLLPDSAATSAQAGLPPDDDGMTRFGSALAAFDTSGTPDTLLFKAWAGGYGIGSVGSGVSRRSVVGSGSVALRYLFRAEATGTEQNGDSIDAFFHIRSGGGTVGLVANIFDFSDTVLAEFKNQEFGTNAGSIQRTGSIPLTLSIGQTYNFQFVLVANGLGGTPHSADVAVSISLGSTPPDEPFVMEPPTSPVPEPSSLILLGMGAVSLFSYGYRQGGRVRSGAMALTERAVVVVCPQRSRLDHSVADGCRELGRA